jgi:hypothetical protein
MAKKKINRRVPQAATPRMYGDGKPSQTAQAAARPGIARTARQVASGAATSGRGTADLAKEYGYVVGDLKRLFIVAAALFAALAALSIVVR